MTGTTLPDIYIYIYIECDLMTIYTKKSIRSYEIRGKRVQHDLS